MKTVLTLAIAMVLSSSAFASMSLTSDSDHVGPGGCRGQFLGNCTEIGDDGNRVGPNRVLCIARDSANQKFTYTGSYGKPTHQNAQGAVKACQRASADPASCHWTACKWAD